MSIQTFVTLFTPIANQLSLFVLNNSVYTNIRFFEPEKSTTMDVQLYTLYQLMPYMQNYTMFNIFFFNKT